MTHYKAARITTPGANLKALPFTGWAFCFMPGENVLQKMIRKG